MLYFMQDLVYAEFFSQGDLVSAGIKLLSVNPECAHY